MSDKTAALDFRQLFKTLPGLYIVAQANLTVVAATDEYLRETMIPREDLVGRNLFDAFPENPDDDTLGKGNIRSSIEKVFQTGKTDVLPIQKYDVRRPAEKGGGYEERYWKLTTVPIFDAAGKISHVIHRAENITEQNRLRKREAEQDKAYAELEDRVAWSESKRRKTADALEDTRMRLESALDAGEIGTWMWDVINDRVVADENLAEFFSVSKEDANGGKIEKYIAAIHPKDAAQVEKRINEALANGDFYEVEYRLVNPDETIRQVVARGRVLRDEEGKARQLPGVVIDITGRRKAQDELLERTNLATLSSDIGIALNRREDLQDLLKHCTDALVEHLDIAFARIWTLDKSGKILELQASSGLYTHLDGDHSRVRVGQYKIGKIAEERQPHLTNNVSDDPRVSDKKWAKREKMASFAGYPLIVEDKLVGVLCAFSRNILTEAMTESMAAVSNTIANAIERKQIEEERQNLLVSERDLRRGAEEANRMKDEFLATLSHELRTPLSSILGWARMLKEKQLSGEQAERAIETIERNAKSQAQLIEDVLDVSRIISGKMRLKVQPLDLSVVIESAIDAVRPAVEAKNITLQRVIDSHVMIAGDADRLQQIVWNLLSNSIKFTPKQGRVQIKMERVNSHVKITVADSGIGIEPETLPYVFERFRQSDSSTTRSHSGLGLGLAIVRHLVELHGGTVHALSGGLNQGSVFTVTFPLIAVRSKKVPLRMELEDAENIQPAASENIAFICPREIKGLRILLVDDEPDTREILMFVFEKCDGYAKSAASVSEALEAIKADKFDVLVSDIGMPERDGYDLIKSIRELSPEQGGQIPAVALTAYARVEDRMRVLSAGFQMHVPKPVEPAELLAVVASLAKRNNEK